MTQTNKEYAEALFTIAYEHGALEEYAQALSEIKTVIEENPEYLSFLDSPALPLSERLGAIDEAFSKGFPEYIVSFLKLLCENGRIRELPQCIEEFDSAVELNVAAKDKLCRKLSKLTGKTVEAVYVTDPTLLGGIKVEIDGKTIDGSITNNLKRIKGVMNG